MCLAKLDVSDFKRVRCLQNRQGKYFQSFERNQIIYLPHYMQEDKTMSSTRTYNLRDMKKIVHNNGFVLKRQTGSHLIYEKAGEPRKLCIGICNANKMVFQRLMKEFDLKL